MSTNASNISRAAPPPHLLRADAAAIADGAGTRVAPADHTLSVLVRCGVPPASATSPWTSRLLAVGPTHWVAALPEAAGADVIDHRRATLIPGLVNAHTHLDLTHIGPRAFDAARGFSAWVEMIRRERRSDPAAIAESVHAGVALLRRAGTVAVGDIAGAVGGRASAAAFHALRDTGIAGVSFIEFFALGGRAEAAIQTARTALEEGHADSVTPSQREGEGGGLGLAWGGHPVRLRIGLSPHATYSAGTAAYRFAADLAAQGIPACSHVAESPEERDLILHHRGPLRTLLESVGVWDEHAAAEFAGARSPVHVALRRARSPVPLPQGGGLFSPPGGALVGRTSCPPTPFSLIHVNDCSDADLADLAAAGTPVVYCPRASAYFGAETHFGPHRYRHMLAAGLTVALGTDSIVNLPRGSDDPRTGTISVLDEMRFLHARDGTDATTLLAMATINGARVLALDEEPFTLLPLDTKGAADSDWRGERPLAGLVALDSGPTTPLGACYARALL